VIATLADIWLMHAGDRWEIPGSPCVSFDPLRDRKCVPLTGMVILLIN
jgi:hypothetical protein